MQNRGISSQIRNVSLPREVLIGARMIFVVFIMVGLFNSCKSPASDLSELDLMSEGIPIKIKAPADVKVKKKDMSIFQDITIKNDSDFYVQITAGEVYNSDTKARKTEELESIKQLSSFSRVISEDDQGFIFERKKGDELTYDFRRIRVQGDTEYLFQTGLIGKFDLEAVKLMYDAVK